MSRGNMIIGVGGLLAFIFFFLPWVGGYGMSFSGARVGGELWLTFIAALGCIAVVVLEFMGKITNKITSYAAIGLAALGLLMILINLGGGLHVKFFLILTILVELAIIGGGVMNLYGKA